MVEVGRFFDAVSYGEADQAEVQSRFRSTGVMSAVGNRLRVSAPGGAFVSVDTGEAMVEGFWYKNTAPVTLAITTNPSGSIRYDLVVVRLNRTTNTLAATILVGTPGGGVPTPVQIAGGIWDLPLAVVTMGVGAVAVVNTTVANSGVLVSSLQAARKNRLHNPTLRINQRGLASVGSSGLYVADRWQCGLPVVTGNFQYALVPSNPPNIAGVANEENTMCVVCTRIGSGAVAASDLVNFQQNISGYDIQPMYGNTLCVSWWSYSAKVGTFGFNLEQVGSDWRYMASWHHAIASGWQFQYVVIPWSAGASWNINTSLAAMIVRFVLMAGTNMVHTVTDQWINIYSKYAPPNITNALTAVNDQIWITRPKLEIGAYPTRFETPDRVSEIIECYYYYQTGYPYGTPVPTTTAGQFYPIGSNSVPHGMYICSIRHIVPMRVAPTTTIYPYTTVANTSRISNDAGTDFGASSGVVGVAYPTHFDITNQSGVTLTTNQFGMHFGWQSTADI